MGANPTQRHEKYRDSQGPHDERDEESQTLSVLPIDKRYNLKEEENLLDD